MLLQLFVTKMPDEFYVSMKNKGVFPDAALEKIGPGFVLFTAKKSYLCCVLIKNSIYLLPFCSPFLFVEWRLKGNRV